MQIRHAASTPTHTAQELKRAVSIANFRRIEDHFVRQREQRLQRTWLQSGCKYPRPAAPQHHRKIRNSQRHQKLRNLWKSVMPGGNLDTLRADLLALAERLPALGEYASVQFRAAAAGMKNHRAARMIVHQHAHGLTNPLCV